MTQQKITPFLWFDRQAEEAARAYTAIFPNSRIVTVTRYSEAGQELHGQKPGAVMTVEFELNGHPFTALNGGPLFKFNEAVSFQIHCDTQAEIDHYWDRLGAGGDPKAQQCGWLKDKYGVSWQVVPAALPDLLADPAKARRVMEALLRMTKLDIRALQDAAAGK
jgi:predicted 3-demethylubiquinone-9 3-methyltransferase (glyoxalase superfamily)